MPVRRSLPGRDRHLVGAWCFADTYGPLGAGASPGMRVPPHPHTGLHTVSWLLGGEILHRDSLGTTCRVRPGELNLMTAGHGISHSEYSTGAQASGLHGAQLWIVQPEAERDGPPCFEHHGTLPSFTRPGATVTVLLGALDGVVSPARTATELVGAELDLAAGTRLRLPLRRDFEHAVLALDKPVTAEGHEIPTGSMLYLPPERETLTVHTADGNRALLIGGVPFEERFVMWWNFLARDHGGIATAREDWESGGTRFGTVPAQDAGLSAPPLPGVRLRSRGRRRAQP
ncbi:pirin [Amycolatopsis antarctica]|uniref:Pirin n=2 Tax=Amycolatopsis antarctica TaxID=1854586 RepID=A0A263D6D5_9PSEU|nr:pirin [Amycolatopsis antarctica]